MPFSSEMSSSSATIENNITRSPPRFPSSAFHYAVLSIKLNEISPHLRGHGMLGLLRWVHSLVPKIISRGSNSIENPNYIHWQRQDQLILGWLLSSLSEKVIGLPTSHGVWKNSWSILCCPLPCSCCSTAHSVSVHQERHRFSEVISKGQHNWLSTCSKPVSEEELLLYILGGLPSEFGRFKTYILVCYLVHLCLMPASVYEIVSPSIKSKVRSVRSKICHVRTGPVPPSCKIRKELSVDLRLWDRKYSDVQVTVPELWGKKDERERESSSKRYECVKNDKTNLDEGGEVPYCS